MIQALHGTNIGVTCTIPFRPSVFLCMCRCPSPALLSDDCAVGLLASPLWDAALSISLIVIVHKAIEIIRRYDNDNACD